MKRMTLQEFSWKAYKTLHNRYVVSHRNESYTEYCRHYKSYRYSLKHQNTPRQYTNYFGARPNPGAGIGHQMANWIAGLWFAEVFQLKFVHIPFSGQKKPFVPNNWDHFLGFGEGEATVGQLRKEGYRPVLLPLFNEKDFTQVDVIKQIIAAYGTRKTVFIAEQDQFYQKQFEVMDKIQEKFYNATSRKEDSLIFNKDHLNIVVHARRGDIVQKTAEKNPNLTMRYQKLDYFISVLDELFGQIKTDRVIDIYLLSQGGEGDYEEFKKYKNIHFCLDMSAQDSFLHMVYADVLITSKSSFSYKPALLNQRGVKICPKNFWHGYPDREDWIFANECGHILGRISKL